MTRIKLKSWPSKLAKILQPLLPEGVFANLGQWYSRYVHESDFEIFDWLAEVPGLVLDVGANRGHSALSVLRHTRRMHVFSVEPNREHCWNLLLIWLLHPLRFRFRLVAAGDTFTHKTLHIPGHHSLGLSALGSLDPSEFEKDHIREELAELGLDSRDKSVFRKVAAQVIPLDDLGLSPDLIKLDVEGFELQALRGLKEALGHLRPALLVEMNHPDRWMPLVKSFGYVFYYYDASTGKLNSYNETDGVLNLFCLHTDSHSLLTQALLKKVKTS